MLDEEHNNTNMILSKKLIFDMNSERTKKRMEQMKRIKKNLNENDTPKDEKSTFNSTQNPNEDLNKNNYHKRNRKINLEKKRIHEILNNSNNTNKSANIIIPFKNSVELNEFSDDIEINISDLDCNINDINQNDINDHIKCYSNPSSSEYAKNFCSSNSKSFILLNNNLIAKAATEKEKNTNSYLLALYPELMSSKNKEKNFDNYYVDDVIKEDIENENPLKQDNNSIDNNKNIKDLMININYSNKIYHKKSKSGNYINNILSNFPKNTNQKILKKEFTNKKINENHYQNNNNHIININRKIFQNVQNISRTFCSPLRNHLTKLSKINLINSYHEYNSNSNCKNKIFTKIYNLSPKNFSNKNIKTKMKITINSNNNSRSNSKNNHQNKKKTKNKNFYTSLSSKFLNKNENYYKYQNNNLLSYIKKTNVNNNNNNKLVNRTSLRLFEIKKAIKTLGNNHLYKKNNFGLFFPKTSKYICNNSIIMQKSYANFEISNRNKIINALQKINYSHLNLYSKAFNELKKCKGNLFSILVSKEKIKFKINKFLFKGLYEVIQDEHNLDAKLIFGIANLSNNININDFENIYNFDLNKEEFTKYKFNSNEPKSFNGSTIIIF